MDKATVVTVHNPFNPAHNRQLEQVGSGITITEQLKAADFDQSKPFICIVNGEPILREQWDSFIIEDEFVVVFYNLPEGGGGSDPFKLVLGLALIVGGVFAGFTLLGFGLVGAGVITLLSSGLLDAPEIPSTDQLPSASPTYSLTAQGNTARLGQAIPVIYGRHRVFPDFALRPYTEFIDDNQFLYQVFVIGQGEYDLASVNIEDTPVANFREITYEKIEPTTDVTLFDHDVIQSVEVANQEIGSADIGPFVVNPSSTSINRIAIDVVFPEGLFRLDSDGDFQNQKVTIATSVTRIDDDGNDIGGHNPAINPFPTPLNITAATNTPVRRTFITGVFGVNHSPGGKDLRTYPTGRYKISIRRIGVIPNNNKIKDKIIWTGLKGYFTNTTNYRGLTLLAMKMRATDNLSQQSSRKVNCVVTRKLPIWRGEKDGWSANTATSSIVWAVADILRNTIYGVGWDDNRIDLEGFMALDAIFTTRGDYFNAVFDRKMSVWEAIKLVCRVGRSVGILQAGIFRIVRDRLQTLPTSAFNTRNIVKDSFAINYAMANEDTVDGIEMEYINPSTWKPDEVFVTHTGGTPVNPAKIKLFGCTNMAHARREALYLARNNVYRRKTIKLATELEGYIPTFGDLVVVSHDMPDWGVSGDVIGFYENDDIQLTPFDEERNHVAAEPSGDGQTIYFNPAITNYIAFRLSDGSVEGPYRVVNGTEVNSVRIMGLINFASVMSNDKVVITHTVNSVQKRFELYYGTAKERTHFMIGRLNKWSRFCVIKSIRPRGEFKVELTMVNEDNRVHAD